MRIETPRHRPAIPCFLPPWLALCPIILFASCTGGSASRDTSACVPGVMQTCVCGGGVPGVQICAPNGSRWLACDCGGGLLDAGQRDGGDGASVDRGTFDPGVPDLSSPDSDATNTTPRDGGEDLVRDVVPDPGSDVGPGASPTDLVRIEPGTFRIGSPVGELGRDPNEIQHDVTLTRAFLMQATEVTQGRWKALMGNTPSALAACGEDCPVESVNWWEALAYANARSKLEGFATCYTLRGCNGSPGEGMDCEGVTVNAPGSDPYACAGYRLPTEAEWEYAYRAGTVTALYDGELSRQICAADRNLEAIGWYCGNSRDTAHPVARKTPNAWGLFDMAGNVWEWCWDTYAEYPREAVVDPVGAKSGPDRLFRGGSWIDRARNARAAIRNADFPGLRARDLGFRLVRTVGIAP